MEFYPAFTSYLKFFQGHCGLFLLPVVLNKEIQFFLSDFFFYPLPLPLLMCFFHLYPSDAFFLPFDFSSTCSVQFSSVTQSCPIPFKPMNLSTLVLPVHHQLPEFTQTLVHWVSDAIQPSHPLSSPSPPAPKHSHPVNELKSQLLLRKKGVIWLQ